ncbi:MAG: hypothetical protein GEU80_01140 [Dehalococcoidia bacterium]|nr:hypothetical protein [Dehalococcoidia bacterium]
MSTVRAVPRAATRGGGMCDPSGDGRPSFAALWSNWSEYDAPAHTKLRLLVRNQWSKLRHGTSCCGNGGEPGC